MLHEKQRILIVDDSTANIKILNDLLKDDYSISFARSGKGALKAVYSQNRPDMILLDIMMPEMDGYEVCRRLKAHGDTKNIPVLFITAKEDVKDQIKGLRLGAVDYITRPIEPSLVASRVQNHMSLYLYREQLEELVAERTKQLRNGYIDTIYRLMLASEYKDEETGDHIKRISHYTSELARQLGMDNTFCETIFHASPMHDIGKVAIPDAVLLKQGPLDDAEWKIMQSHAEIGAKILEGSESPYLRAAVDIARNHHERWDGSGYPHGLNGEDIPLVARIMNIADQYDALRSKRPYKPAFDHPKVMSIIIEGDGRTIPSHFDPAVLSAFKTLAAVFNDIFEMYKDTR